MQGVMSVYTRNPVPNAPELKKLSSVQRVSHQVQSEETDIVRKVRKRLYQKHDGIAKTEKPRMLTKEQKQKIAKDQVLATLMDPTLIDPTKITDVLAEWANKDLGIEESVANRIFASSLVTTESIPTKGMFRIRVKI